MSLMRVTLLLSALGVRLNVNSRVPGGSVGFARFHDANLQSEIVHVGPPTPAVSEP
jgi:hypothetical protein